MYEIRSSIDKGCRGVSTADDIEGDVAAKIPDTVGKENRKGAPETLVEEQPEQGCFGDNICKPECVVQAHKLCSAYRAYAILRV